MPSSWLSNSYDDDTKSKGVLFELLRHCSFYMTLFRKIRITQVSSGWTCDKLLEALDYPPLFKSIDVVEQAINTYTRPQVAQLLKQVIGRVDDIRKQQEQERFWKMFKDLRRL